MTTAKLASKPPKSSGLTHGFLDQLYEARSAGKTVPLLDLFGKAAVVGHGEKGDSRWLELEWVRLEVADDGETSEQISHLVTVSYERRTSQGQGTLFFDTGTEEQLTEQRTLLLGFISEWQAEQDPPVTDDDVAERWVSFHGGNYDHRIDHAAPTHLREFAISIGALAEEESDDGTGDASGEAESDDAAEPDVASDDAAASASKVVPFQQPVAEQ